MQANPATNVPNPYPKITADKASDITSQFNPQPKSLALQEPDHTPAQYVDTLEKNNQSEDAIKTMAHGMPERESVWYACQSSDRVADKMAPADKDALAAAKDWVKNPSPATQQQAADAAAKTDYQGPGAWAAQAAAWSQSTPGTASALPASAAVPGGGQTPAAATLPSTGAMPKAAAVPGAGSLAKAGGVPAAPSLPKVGEVPKAPTIPGADALGKSGSLPAAGAIPKAGAPPLAGRVGAPGGGAPGAPGVKAGSLTPHAASGSVLLAAAMENNKIGPKAPVMAAPSAPTLKSPAAPKLPVPGAPKPTIPPLAAPKAPAAPEMPPAQQAEVAKIHKPYIDLGKAIASGKNTWAAPA
jgi:hypothetical protein